MTMLLQETSPETNELAELQQIWTSAVVGFAPNAALVVSSSPNLYESTRL